MKILVAEDDRELSRLYKILLEDLGHNVLITEDGQACVDAYQLSVNTNKTLDLVILDHRMPKKNGMEVAKEITSMNPTQKMIMITAYAGVLDFSEKPEQMKVMVKPFEVDDFLTTVKELTE